MLVLHEVASLLILGGDRKIAAYTVRRAGGLEGLAFSVIVVR